MFYFFERDTTYIRCELKPVTGSNAFQIVILEPGQAERVEAYPDWESANARWETLKERFRQDGWRGPLGRE